MWYWHNPGAMGWAGGIGMLVLMILILAGLFTITVLLVRRWERPTTSNDAAQRLLDERFARGEIDEEEYEKRRTALRR